MGGKRMNFCGSPDHGLSRRGFLGTAAAAATAFAADMTALNVLRQPLLAAEMKKQQKRVILLWLAGGASQLETWDPKPGAPTGGPFRSIPTAVPGIDTKLLNPDQTWADKKAFDETARKLVGMFQKNFTKYEQTVDADVRAAAPEVRMAAE